MKCLIIGNSHVGAIIKAYKEKKYEGFELDFLAMGGNLLLPQLEVTNSFSLGTQSQRIQSLLDNLELSESNNLDKYDYIIVYGCQLRSQGAGENWFKHISQHNEQYSSQAWNVCMQDFILNSSHIAFLRQLAGVGNEQQLKKVISMPSPHPNERMLTKLRVHVSTQLSLQSAQTMSSEITKLGVCFLDTPCQLLNDEQAATRAEFLSETEEDYSHLNTKGGHVVITYLIDYLSCKKSSYS